MEILTYLEDLREWGRTKPLQYIINENGCWNCISHSDRGKGYHRIKRDNKVQLVHRYVYEKEFGKIQNESLVVMHSCDNRACLNPEHLSLGTSQNNYQDAKEKGRNSKGEIHGMSKLTLDQVREIRLSKKKGVELAHEYNVSKSTISCIKKNKIWKEDIC